MRELLIYACKTWDNYQRLMLIMREYEKSYTRKNYQVKSYPK